MLPRRLPQILQAATPHRVTLIRAGRVNDPYGDSVLDFDNPEKTQSGVRGYVQATATQQLLTDGLDQVVQQWRVFLPTNIDIAGWDRLLWQGHTFTFDGAPQILQRQGSPIGYVVRLLDQEVAPGVPGVH